MCSHISLEDEVAVVRGAGEGVWAGAEVLCERVRLEAKRRRELAAGLVHPQRTLLPEYDLRSQEHRPCALKIPPETTPARPFFEVGLA